jgi:hypothetical protein
VDDGVKRKQRASLDLVILTAEPADESAGIADVSINGCLPGPYAATVIAALTFGVSST